MDALKEVVAIFAAVGLSMTLTIGFLLLVAYVVVQIVFRRKL